MIKGVHGTCRHYAGLIEEKGFKSSSYGRMGSGAYFWRYFSCADFAEHLGFSWWKKQHKRGAYNKIQGIPKRKLEESKKCALVHCEIAVDPSREVLDLSSGAAKEHVRKMLRAKLEQLSVATGQDKDKDKAISELIDLFVKMAEANAGTRYKVVITDVATPGIAIGGVGAFLGSSAEAVVARDVDCITVRDTRKVESYDYVK